MREAGARFASLVVRMEHPDTLRLSWHWDLGGALLSLESVIARDSAVPSIVEIYPGADWAEREAREYYSLVFEGRDETAPLMLREGEAIGVLLPKAGERL
jgi:Ni,Fe-hydrogenase III component G